MGLENLISSDEIANAAALMLADLEQSLDPRAYFTAIGIEPYEWQVFVLEQIQKGVRFIHITGARQVGKTFITAGIPAHVSKNEKALTLIYAPSDEQAGFSIEYLKEYIARDESYPDLKLESRDHVQLPNGSYIKANTSSAKTKRGRSKPRIIIFDEAALIEDELYGTITPMLTHNPHCVVIAISTPYGKKGWFFNARKSDRWLKIEVKAPYDIEGTNMIIPAMPEAEYKTKKAKESIHAFYSSRHDDIELIQSALIEHGSLWVRQEYFCEFVEPEDQAFSYDDIDKAFGYDEVKPLKLGEIAEIESEVVFT